MVPFVGLAEASVLTVFRWTGVSLQRIRLALAELERHIGLEHAPASRALYTDGLDVLYDYGEHHQGTDAGRGALQLVVVTGGQRVASTGMVLGLGASVPSAVAPTSSPGLPPRLPRG